MAAVGWRQGFVAGALALAGFARRRVPGQPPRPGAAARRLASPYAPLFALVGARRRRLDPGRRARGRRRRRCGARSRSRASGASTASSARCSARRSRSGWPGSPARSLLQTPGARQLRRDIQRSEILQRLNDVLPPSGPILNALGALRPVPARSTARRPPCPRRARRSPATRRCARRGASVVRDPRHRLRPGRRGLGLGGAATGSWSPTPTWWRARTTRSCRRAGDRAAAVDAHGGRLRPAQRRRGAARLRACTRRAADARRATPRRARRRDPRASRRTARTTSGRPAWAQTRDGALAGRLRQRPGAPPDDDVPRRGAAGQLGRADRRRATAGC